MINLIKNGSAASFSLANFGPRMLQRDFSPGFYVEHFIKDLGITLTEAKTMNLSLPNTSQVKQFYTALVAQGGSKMGTQGLLTVLEQLNGV